MKALLQKGLTFLIPHRCLLCRDEVLSEKSLCSQCWPKMSFISPPFCDCCGQPFDYEVDPKSLCGACLETAPFFHQARSALLYSPASKALLMRFKHGDETELAPTLATWLHLVGKELLHEADFLIPIPLHWTRLLARRYNQSALLAQSLSRISGIPCRLLGLKRHKKTPSQGTMTKKQRHQNVAKAFSVPLPEREKLQGKKVVLIDDVLTSGATVEQASKTLKKAGVHCVNVLTVAR